MSSLSDLYSQTQAETIDIGDAEKVFVGQPQTPIAPPTPIVKDEAEEIVARDLNDTLNHVQNAEEMAVTAEVAVEVPLTEEYPAKDTKEEVEMEMEIVEPLPSIENGAIGVPNDLYLTTLLEHYTPDLVADKDSNTDVLPRKESPLYEIEGLTDNYKNRIIDVYDVDDGTRASYSLEELGLHNRLTEVQGVERDFGHHILIQAPMGDLVVAKDLDTGSGIEDVFMEEAKGCVRQGKRIEINLLESYKFEDNHGRILIRQRFRATMSEIRCFIRNTGMRGRITKDAILVIFE